MDKTIPKLNPQQVNEITQQESNKSSEQQTVTDVIQTDAKTTIKNTPPSLAPQGADKLAFIINQKRNVISETLVPIVVGIAFKAGIKYIGTLQVELPDSCLSPKEVSQLTLTRNQLVNTLNNIIKTLDALTKVLAGISLTLAVVIVLLNTVKKARILLKKIIIPLLPVPGPGSPDPGNKALIKLDDLRDVQKTTEDKIKQLSGALASATLSISLLNVLLLKLLALLKPIDTYLQQCPSLALDNGTTISLIPLAPTLLQLEQVNNEIQQNSTQETHNGFILEVVEVSYSPTTTRRKAVAKNASGIVLISTPLSFTTEPQILIEELKLLIDTNNLKAY